MAPHRDQFKLLDKIVIGTTTFSPPFKASSVLHDEARFIHVVHGNSRLYVPNHQLSIQASDSFMMKCESFVNNWFENEDGSQNEVLIVHFYPDVLNYVYDERIPAIFTEKKEVNPKAVERIPLNVMIENYIQGLRFYFNNKAFVTDEFIKIKIKELILILLNSDKTGRIRAILSDLFQSNEYEFKEIIHSHLYEDLSIQDLAFFSGLSLSSFKRKFKSVFDTSPTQYIKTKRLEKAKTLLATTNLRISDIAYDCGFNDIGYFSKTFHAAFDCAPSDYRKAHVS
ncbi:MAG: AraC family transcriptional regulator [Bacteroidota bacterium]